MKKLHILCDLDSIAADHLTPWLAAYNKKYNDALTIADLKTFDTHLYVKPECGEKIFEFVDAEMFLNLSVMPGAKDALQELTNIGHTIHIVTAFSPDKPDTASAKVIWTRQNFPFVNKRMITLMSQKHLIDADVLIDDRPDTIRACHALGKTAWMHLATIAYPYNECVKELYNTYAIDYRTPAKCWNEIFNNIVAYSETKI